MIMSWLFDSPMLFVAWVAAILIALTIHEFSHAASAAYFGDDTAKNLGRLTLNPIPHIDPVGLLMLMFIGFGWAKPVPVNVYKLRNQRVSSALVSAAGPLSNLIGFFVFVVILKLVSPYFGPDNLLISFLFMLTLINVVLMVFNLIPIPPLDGSNILFSILPDKYNEFKNKLATNGPWILIMIIIADGFLNLGIFASLFGWIFSLLSIFL